MPDRPIAAKITQCDTCRYSRAALIGAGPRTILQCDYPGISARLRMLGKDAAAHNACRRYEYEPGAGG